MTNQLIRFCLFFLGIHRLMGSTAATLLPVLPKPRYLNNVGRTDSVLALLMISRDPTPTLWRPRRPWRW